MRITAVTCVKNEGPFLLEWIAFQRLIGVTDFLFYSNDCDDGTDVLLDALARRGGLCHLPNPAQGRTYQMEALKHARAQEVVARADWVWVADVDEFLNIHVPGHRIPDLIAACNDPHAISVSFQFFANGDVETFEDRPVIEQFLHSHNPDLWGGESAIEVKTLTRRDLPLRYFGAHRPFLKPGQHGGIRWTDGAGRPVPDVFLGARRKDRLRKFPAKGARGHATLNHYALRALDSYVVKAERGDVNRANRAFDDSYWRARNDPSFLDDSILRYLPDLRAALEEMKADPEIKALHDACVTAHKAKCAALCSQPIYQEMRATLKAAAKLPPAEEALLRSIGAWVPAR